MDSPENPFIVPNGFSNPEERTLIIDFSSLYAGGMGMDEEAIDMGLLCSRDPNPN